MKHNLQTTLVLIILFVAAQIVGLAITSQYIGDETLYIIEPPEVENESLSFIPIILAVLVGTGVILLLAKYNLNKVWAVWFFLSIWIALLFALYPIYNTLLPKGALLVFVVVTFVLAYLKLRWKQMAYQNIVELFIYGGIISLFMPIINVFSATVLLLLISGYDMFAVWKSKHMIKLANFQTEQQLFAGLQLPKVGTKKHTRRTHHVKKHAQKAAKKSSNAADEGQIAILGGGDIAFPLLFTTALLKAQVAFLVVTLSVVGATAGLALLLYTSKPKRFYPAMPFICVGLFLGAILGVVIW